MKEFNYTKFSDLKKYRIGLSRGWSQGDKFDDFIKKNPKNFEVASTYVQNLHKLLYKRIDVFPLDPNIAAHVIRKEFPPEKRKLFKMWKKYKFNSYPMYVVCSKKYSRCEYYLKKFNEGQRLISKDGTKKRIIQAAQTF